MNQAQADRIKGIIDEDANLRYGYFRGDDKACFIGGLWLASGGTQETFRQTHKQMGNYLTDSSDAVAPLSMEFGLDLDQLRKAQRINDSHQFTKERRPALKKYIDTLVKE